MLLITLTNPRRVESFEPSAPIFTIIAGDLNATLRHGKLGDVTTHVDVLSTVPVTRRGTWPVTAPQILRSSIDHILVPRNSYAVSDSRVIDIPGSDHAAIVTTILLEE